MWNLSLMSKLQMLLSLTIHQHVSAFLPANRLSIIQPPAFLIPLYASVDNENVSEVISSFSSSSSSSFTDEELIQIAKDYLANPSFEKYSSDFVFRGPVIGPLNKEDFMETLKGMAANGKKGLSDAFPDFEANAFGFCVDPVEKNRVWYMVRPRGTFSGPFDHPIKGRIEPTGAKLIGPPESRSFIIDSDGLIKHITVGYVADRFTGDTTGGKGAVYGQYHVMGDDLDDTVGNWKTDILQWLVANILTSLPKSFSKKESLPSWWTDTRMGAQK
eukprot:CAMPEP_0184863182 /NCGR_PEP_ID=MMETSP0580-20130426/9768_1 /TAXON_ID=1118495 /ORGANISM="Dactyliosolen fragilissimus" /LENGTH=272 /DNA_ID=CAMNT_0027361363 /DNA_START=49 /DNA_END=867 /DNA_ORIENTATION=-